ncbi:DinB family protein [Streptomyces sp. NRRL WC-3549]|uniref:DinB family protein n=1 Tax=Streptomyces sp. NRRL WC-3549 TaxID=1463925 RepID=UPI0004C725CD|nr:DinB family protein [Streptomyces sp. NRRL WC-3549]
MTWTAPEVTRTTGPLTGGERETLTGFLAFYRSTLLHKCAGLTGRQLAEVTAPPSNLTLLGLVRHMAKVERIWFRLGFAGLDLPPMYEPAKGKDADFEDLAPDRAEHDYARLVEEMRLADEAVSGAALDDTFTWRGTVHSLRMAHIHMIAEYARHVGHADLLRERLDGATGA